MSQLSEIQAQYGFNPQKESTDMVQIEQSRAMHETQSRLIIAKKFPRDVNKAFAKIMLACQRPSLADQSMYAFPRSNDNVTGPSIRLAEVIIQNWGNADFGIKEISQANGMSTVKAFAIDLENNVQQEKTFQVPHVRYTKKGSFPLTDPRDIYEMVANQGARRLRACILGIVPPDIIEAAVEQCQRTLNKNTELDEEIIKKLVSAYADLGVKVTQLEKYVGHTLETLSKDKYLELRTIYKTIKDGMGKKEDYFEADEEPEAGSANKSERMASRMVKQTQKEDQPENKTGNLYQELVDELKSATRSTMIVDLIGLIKANEKILIKEHFEELLNFSDIRKTELTEYEQQNAT